ncbi:MAG TPA: gas vesicle protein [Thermoanaerobaculia bacterium]|nr:gas vesicle protein [Thermoanaerobaculia bacterium]
MNEERDLSLVEALDHLLARGVVIAGEAVISIGGIDLLYLGLNVVLANVDVLSPSAQQKRRTRRELPKPEA